jgi:hypothetical protein
MNEKKNKDEVINVKALDALIAEHGHSPEAILGKEGAVGSTCGRRLDVERKTAPQFFPFVMRPWSMPPWSGAVHQPV